MASNDQHVPIAPRFSDRAWEEESQAQHQGDAAQAEENSMPQQDEAGPSHSKSRFL